MIGGGPVASRQPISVRNAIVKFRAAFEQSALGQGSGSFYELDVIQGDESL